MAYVSQDKKKAAAPLIKALCKKYGVSGSLSVRNHSTLVLTLSKGKLDFFKDHEEYVKERGSIDINHYWIDENYQGDVKDFLKEAANILRGPEYYDRSDAMTDYFDCSHYIQISVGKWDKPYIITE